MWQNWKAMCDVDLLSWHGESVFSFSVLRDCAKGQAIFHTGNKCRQIQGILGERIHIVQQTLQTWLDPTTNLSHSIC